MRGLIFKHVIFIHFTVDSDTEEITIRHEEGGDIIATSTQTIKDPDGTVRKVYKVERLREDAKGGSVRLSYRLVHCHLILDRIPM